MLRDKQPTAGPSTRRHAATTAMDQSGGDTGVLWMDLVDHDGATRVAVTGVEGTEDPDDDYWQPYTSQLTAAQARELATKLRTFAGAALDHGPEGAEIEPAGLYLGTGEHLDWSTTTPDGGRQIKVGNGVDAVTVDLTSDQAQHLRAQLHYTLTTDPRAEQFVRLGDGDDAAYIDWSTSRPDGGRQVAVRNRDGAAVTNDLTRPQMAALDEQLAADLASSAPAAPPRDATDSPDPVARAIAVVEDEGRNPTAARGRVCATCATAATDKHLDSADHQRATGGQPARIFGGSALHLGDAPGDPYLDWSVPTSGGGRSLELGSGQDTVQLDLNPKQLRELVDALTATITADDINEVPGVGERRPVHRLERFRVRARLRPGGRRRHHLCVPHPQHAAVAHLAGLARRRPRRTGAVTVTPQSVVRALVRQVDADLVVIAGPRARLRRRVGPVDCQDGDPAVLRAPLGHPLQDVDLISASEPHDMRVGRLMSGRQRPDRRRLICHGDYRSGRYSAESIPIKVNVGCLHN